MSDDKLNDLIKLGAACDWMTPTWGLLQNIAHGSHADFGIVAGFFTIGDIRRILRANRVDVWGLVYTVDFDMLMFSVTKEQAWLAFSVLKKAGVPVLYSPAEAGRRRVANTGSQRIDTPPQPDLRPTVALSNTFQTGSMSLVSAPSVWGLLGRLIARIGH